MAPTENNENTEQTTSEQAAQAPDVATAGATDQPAGSVEVGEVEREQQEHLERRTESQLPDPGTAPRTEEQLAADKAEQDRVAAAQAQQNQAATDQQQGDVPADQLASDGDQVVEGLSDNGQEAGA